MKALEIISAYYDGNGGFQIVPMFPLVNDSFTLRSSNGKIITMWSNTQSDGIMYVRSNRFHDNNSIQLTGFAQDGNLLPLHAMQKLFAGDTLTLQASNSGGDRDGLSIFIYYDDLPRLKTNFIDYAEFQKRFTGNIVTAFNIHTAVPANPPAYESPQPITLNGNFFKRDKQYALIGYQVNNFQFLSLTWYGPCTGNLRVGGNLDLQTSYPPKSEYFLHLSKETGLATIPVMNGLDAPVMIQEVASVSFTSTDIETSTIFAELEPLV